MPQWFRQTLGPFLLMLCCPPIVMLLVFTNQYLNGSLQKLWQMIQYEGFFNSIHNIWGPVFWGTPIAWKIILTFVFFQLSLLLVLPGKLVKGPISPAGQVPIYKDNGFLAFITTILTYFIFSNITNWFSSTLIYDHFLEILGALNSFSLLLCLFLYLKGRFYPSSNDASLSRNFIFDYYWGTELYPVIGKVNLKMFINCRLGMMSWPLIIISFTNHQSMVYGLSNSMMIGLALQLIYIAKFFWWENGYLSSLDIMHDRAGFYICWGCLVWVPGFYTLSSGYLANHPIHLDHFLALFIFSAGVMCILVNYFADRQRQIFRRQQGECKIWGKAPKIIRASYQCEDGKIQANLLLASGWWGISRHFHYLPELGAAFLWSLPALFTHLMPYLYVIFLSILLLDRAFRDDKRCRLKYGDFWETYCQMVPYKIIPFLI